MIQDKDYTLRLIRQLTQALEKLILGKPEESLMQKELDYDSLMKDIFKINFDELASKPTEEIISLVEEKQEKDWADYYEMLGNLFYQEGKRTSSQEFLLKAKKFYQLYLEKSKIFALPIINRIGEIK